MPNPSALPMDVKHKLPREVRTAGGICDIFYSPNNQNFRGGTPFLADIALPHSFIGNAVDRDRWGNYQGKNLSQRAQSKGLKHAWADNLHVCVPFVSHMLGSMSGESAATLCFCVSGVGQSARRGASRKAGGMVLGQITALARLWTCRIVLSAVGMRA